MKDKIEVSYDGKYPNTCSGTLIIKVNDEEIYNKKFCCGSTGSVWFDDDWEEHVECGKLIWNDAKDFNDNIQKEVERELNKCDVCCGGCV